VSRKGRSLGWSVAKVELMKARPVQCYKCWHFGHVRNKCESVTDRTNHCFKCGNSDHTSYSCLSDPFCVICADLATQRPIVLVRQLSPRDQNLVPDQNSHLLLRIIPVLIYCIILRFCNFCTLNLLRCMNEVRNLILYRMLEKQSEDRNPRSRP